MNQRLAHVLTDITTGLGFVFVLSVTTAGFGHFLGLEIPSNVNDLGKGIAGNPALLALGLFYFLVIGALVFVFGHARPTIAKIFKAENVKMPEEIAPKGKKKAYIMTFISVGIVTSVIIVAFGSFVSGINDAVNVTNLFTLAQAVSEGNPLLWVLLVFGYAILGIIVAYFGRQMHNFRKSIDPIAKI